MKLSQPKFITWLIGLLLAVLALLGQQGIVPAVTSMAFWLAFIGLALMLVATAVKGL
jgi:hypothetical protein